MKLQWNFSWQAYEDGETSKEDQFAFQLQNQYNLIANSVNATIDDESFYLRERATSYTWVGHQQIYTKTLATVAWTAAGTVNIIPLGITGGTTGNFRIVKIDGFIDNGALSTSTTLVLPDLDVTTASNDIQMTRVGETITLTSGGMNYSTYSGYVTVYYIKS